MKTGLFLMTAIFFAFSPHLCFDWAISGGLPNIQHENGGRSSPESPGKGLMANGWGRVDLETDAAAEPYTVTIVDDPEDTTTWLQRWDEGVPNPGGIAPAGWYDVAGSAVFETYRINVTWSGDDIRLEILTDFPQWGYGDGTPYGYPNGGLYQLADLLFDLDMDGVWETGVALIDHGAIPEDPGGMNPPGYGLPADSFVKGKIYSVTSWFSPEDIHFYHWGYAGKYDMEDPKTPIGWMRLGSLMGEAEITYISLGDVHPRYRIEVVLKGVNANGQWDRFGLCWGTGNCANDIISGVVFGPPESVPSMNQWGVIIFGITLMLSGIWVSTRRKCRNGHKPSR